MLLLTSEHRGKTRTWLKAFLIFASLTINFAESGIALAWQASTFLSACAILCIYALIVRLAEPKFSGGGGLALSIASTLGEVLRICGGLLFFGSRSATLLALIITVSGRYFFFTYVLAITHELLNKLEIYSKDVSYSFFDKSKIFFIQVGLLLLAWMPCLISMFPGSICPDYNWMLEQGRGLSSFSTHHPLFLSLFYGFLWNMSEPLFGEVGALGTTMLFQSVVMAFLFSYALVLIKCITDNDLAVLIALLLWAFIPEVSSYAQWLVKDTLSAVALCFVLLLCVARLWEHQAQRPHSYMTSWPALVIVGVIASLTRNNVVYIVAAAFFAILLVSEKKRLALAGILVLIVGYFGINNGLAYALGASKGSPAEALSLPLMQTARTTVKHSDDITPEEEKTLRELFGDERYENMAEYYYPAVSDAVKGGIATSKDVLVSYLGVWIAQGLRHPMTYLESFLLSGVGYWSCDYYSTTESVVLLSTLHQSWNDQFAASTTEAFPDLRNAYIWVIGKIKALPFLNLLFCPAFYVTFDAVLLARMARKKSQIALVSIPLAMLLLVCMASPLNGSVRYALPFVFMLPLLFGLSFIESQEDV